MSTYREFPIANRLNGEYYGGWTSTWENIKYQLDRNRSFASHAMLVYLHDEITKANQQYKAMHKDKQMERVPIITDDLQPPLSDEITKLFFEELKEMIDIHVHLLRQERRERLRRLTDHMSLLNVKFIQPPHFIKTDDD
jgi:virulence-associated protein VapD